MQKVLVFAGTIEGRKIAEFLDAQDVATHICVATEYGESLLPKGGHLEVSHDRLTEEEMEALHIEALPTDLNEAIEEMEKDEFIQGILGDHVSKKYAEAKREEWAAYRQQITDWEINEYLYKI